MNRMTTGRRKHACVKVGDALPLCRSVFSDCDPNIHNRRLLKVSTGALTLNEESSKTLHLKEYLLVAKIFIDRQTALIFG